MWRHFILKDPLDRNLMWMRDTGLIQKMETDSFREIAKTPIPQVGVNQSLTFLR